MTPKKKVVQKHPRKNWEAEAVKFAKLTVEMDEEIKGLKESLEFERGCLRLAEVMMDRNAHQAAFWRKLYIVRKSVDLRRLYDSIL